LRISQAYGIWCIASLSLTILSGCSPSANKPPQTTPRGQLRSHSRTTDVEADSSEKHTKGLGDRSILITDGSVRIGVRGQNVKITDVFDQLGNDTLRSKMGAGVHYGQLVVGDSDYINCRSEPCSILVNHLPNGSAQEARLLSIDDQAGNQVTIKSKVAFSDPSWQKSDAVWEFRGAQRIWRTHVELTTGTNAGTWWEHVGGPTATPGGDDLGWCGVLLNNTGS
jgi:hypothetical protein